MQYLHKFTDNADFDAAYNGSSYHEPWVSYTVCNNINEFTAKLDFYSEYVSDPYTFTFVEVKNYCIWEASANGSNFYVATNTRNVADGDFVEEVTKNGDNYSGTFINIGDNDIKLADISITDSSLEHRVDYNKDLPDVDMIVDYAQGEITEGYGSQGCKIIYAANDIGIIAENKVWDMYQYTFSESSSIGPNGTKELLKVRVLNFEDLSEPIDIEVSLYNRYSDYASWMMRTPVGSSYKYATLTVDGGANNMFSITSQG